VSPVEPIRGIEADTDAGGHGDLVPPCVERRGNDGPELAGDEDRVGRMFDLGRQDHELVAVGADSIGPRSYEPGTIQCNERRMVLQLNDSGGFFSLGWLGGA
jgi:hypothetical protein